MRGCLLVLGALIVGWSGVLYAEEATAPTPTVAPGIRPTSSAKETDPVGRLIKQSNAIVRGKVAAKRISVVESIKVNGQMFPTIETELTIDVAQRIKGMAFPPQARIVVPERCLSEMGKCVGDTIKEGEEFIFFLVLSRTGRWVALGANEGVQRVIGGRLAISNLGVADLVSRVGKSVSKGFSVGPTSESR